MKIKAKCPWCQGEGCHYCAGTGQDWGSRWTPVVVTVVIYIGLLVSMGSLASADVPFFSKVFGDDTSTTQAADPGAGVKASGYDYVDARGYRHWRGSGHYRRPAFRSRLDLRRVPSRRREGERSTPRTDPLVRRPLDCKPEVIYMPIEDIELEQHREAMRILDLDDARHGRKLEWTGDLDPRARVPNRSNEPMLAPR